ncbi:MAG: hypothetical protein AAGI10_14440 [Pseudomonadota bacterium]
MATIPIGRLKLDTYPIQMLSDWQKVRKHGWRQLGLGYTELGIYDCAKKRWAPKPRKQIQIPVTLQTFSFSPMGKPLPQRKKAIEQRIIASSGLGKKFGSALVSRFPAAKVDVPQERLDASLDTNYRNLLYYSVSYRYILCRQRHANPHDDYLILSLPEKVRWHNLLIGICGIEEKVYHAEFGPGSNDFYFKFKSTGTYKKLSGKPRHQSVFVDAFVNSKGNVTPVPYTENTQKWREILASDAEQKKYAAAKAGGSAAWGGSWSIEFTPNYTLQDARHKEEVARLSKKYG